MKPIMITLLYLTFGGDIKLDTFEIHQECSGWVNSNITITSIGFYNLF